MKIKRKKKLKIRRKKHQKSFLCSEYNKYTSQQKKKRKEKRNVKTTTTTTTAKKGKILVVTKKRNAEIFCGNGEKQQFSLSHGHIFTKFNIFLYIF